MVAVIGRPAAVLVLAATDIATRVGTTRTVRIWIATRHARKGIRAADLIAATTERTTGFARITCALAGGGIKVLRIRAGGNAMVIAADIVV